MARHERCKTEGKRNSHRQERVRAKREIQAGGDVHTERVGRGRRRYANITRKRQIDKQIPDRQVGRQVDRRVEKQEDRQVDRIQDTANRKRYCQQEDDLFTSAALLASKATTAVARALSRSIGRGPMLNFCFILQPPPLLFCLGNGRQTTRWGFSSRHVEKHVWALTGGARHGNINSASFRHYALHIYSCGVFCVSGVLQGDEHEQQLRGGNGPRDALLCQEGASGVHGGAGGIADGDHEPPVAPVSVA